MACKVPSCKNVKRLNVPGSGITFHRFPKGKRFKIFKEIIGLPNLQWGPGNYICSNHFLDTDFYPGQKRTLKNVATPSRNLSQMEVCEEASSDTSCLLKIKDDLALTESDSKLLRTRILTSSSSLTTSCVISSPHQEKGTFREPLITKSPDTSSDNTSSSTKQNIVELIQSLHNYSLSPEKEGIKSVETKKKSKKLVNAVCKSRRKVQQLEKKITSLQKITDDLKAKGIMLFTGLDQLQ